MEKTDTYNRDVVVISVDPWKEDRWARKQMFAWLLSTKFRNVIYYVDPGFSERSMPHIERIKPNLFLVDVPLVPKFLKDSSLSRLSVQLSCIMLWLCMLWLGTKRPVFIYYHSRNLPLTEKLASFFGKSLICYDRTDEWSEFPGLEDSLKTQLKEDELNAIGRSDIVLAVSEKLTASAKQINPKTYYLPNATSLDNFRRASLDIPVQFEVLNIAQPKIGYMGKLALWKTDFGLLEYIVETKPGWSLIFLGPVIEEAKPFADKLGRHTNVHFLGAKDYYSLPEYLKGIDVCILPHVVSPLTNSMDPIKLYDYLATGKQIVSTPVAEAVKFKEVIRVAYSNDEFVKQVEEAIQNLRNHNSARQLELAGQHSWESRLAKLSRIIEDNIST
jgi:hypothetical protein